LLFEGNEWEMGLGNIVWGTRCAYA